MELKDDAIIEIIETGGASGLEEALQRNNGGKKIRMGDLSLKPRQATQRLIDALESKVVTETRNIGSAGFEINIDGILFHKVAPFTSASKEALDLKTIVLTKGTVLPKDGPQRHVGA